MDLKEFEFIAKIRRAIGPDARVSLGIGDDAAWIGAPGNGLLVTVDMLLEGVHFDLARSSARQVGAKAMRVNLSDIAAMAGEPLAAVIAVGLPSSTRRAADGAGTADLAEQLFVGLKDAADEFGVAIIGGDTNRSAGGLVISVTLLGTPSAKGPVLRSGARPGDALCVTGKLGYSLEGRHLDFTPRVREAKLLHENYELHAMLDVSDGLASDLFHLTEESGVGAIVDAESIPIYAAALTDDRSPLDHALNDGEDFELLFTLPEGEAARLISEQPLRSLGVEVTRVGAMTEERETWLRSTTGIVPFPRGGFRHEWS